MTERKIREIINCFIDCYKENQKRWKNERYSHYDFFKLLFDVFEPNEIRKNFKWEYPVGVPDYGTGYKEAAVDIIFINDSEKWIAVEIELVGADKLGKELNNCVHKLKTAPECRKSMIKGYIIPLLTQKAEKKARGQEKSYSEFCTDAINNAKEKIGDSPIEILTDGILLS